LIYVIFGQRHYNTPIALPHIANFTLPSSSLHPSDIDSTHVKKEQRPYDIP
jgi:hypothetical protein